MARRDQFHYPPSVGRSLPFRAASWLWPRGGADERRLAAAGPPLALLSFNVGVEIGQVAFVLLIVALERSFRQLEIRWPRWAEVLPGYTVGSLGAFWTIQRTAILLGVGL